MPKTDDYEPELVEKNGSVFYLSDDGFGTMIAWSTCHGSSGGCGNPIMDCNCKGGPKEPYYITRWRVEAQGGTFVMPRHKSSMRQERSFTARKSQSASTIFSETQSGPKGISDFIDADVIARVKAASEERRDD